MTTEHDDLDALRAAVYRPGATEEDRRRYAAALPGPVGAAVGAAPRAQVGGRRRRGIVASASAVVVLAVVGVLIAVAARPSPPPYPVVASTPIPFIGDADEIAVSRADLRTLFLDAEPFLGLFLAEHRTGLSSSLRTDSIAVDGRGTGPTTVSLAGIATPGQATGLMTVLLACDRRAAYSWVLTGPPDAKGRPVRIGASGSDCGTGIETATFVPRPDHVPTRIRITVPEGVRTIVEVDLSKY